jgi:phospholipase/carboxylesterase
MDRSIVPECVEVVTGPEPRHAVIWLHGLGADGHDFEPIVPQLGLPTGAAVRFVFPHAPTRPVTINGGMVMRAWYDITGTELVRREDAASIEASAQLVAGLIEREARRGIQPGNIVLAGFSQGAVIALYAGLRHPEGLAGILALSGYIALADRLAGEIGTANAATPILMMHGDQDPVIPLFLAESGRQRLESLGCAVQWHTYPMGHGVCMEQVVTVGGWLRARFGL